MAPNTITTALRDALEDLVDEEWERFVFQLLDRRKKPRVTRSKVVGKSHQQITTVLVKTYTERGALKVTLETLKASGFNQTAKQLDKATKNLTSTAKRKSRRKGGAASRRVMAEDAVDASGSSSQDPVNFIRDHKMELISCLKADLIILQYVHQKKIVADREYDILKSTSPPEKAVTDLIDVVMHKTGEICSRFLQILQQPDVVETYPMLKDIINNCS